MIPSLTNGSSSSQQSTGTQSTASAAASAADPMANEQTFLQLLVAQLENQDPLDPQDGTQFVTELAQFTSVEQEIQMRTDLDSMNGIMTTDASQATSTNQSDQTNQGSTATP